MFYRYNNNFAFDLSELSKSGQLPKSQDCRRSDPSMTSPCPIFNIINYSAVVEAVAYEAGGRGLDVYRARLQGALDLYCLG